MNKQYYKNRVSQPFSANSQMNLGCTSSYFVTGLQDLVGQDELIAKSIEQGEKQRNALRHSLKQTYMIVEDFKTIPDGKAMVEKVSMKKY